VQRRQNRRSTDVFINFLIGTAMTARIALLLITICMFALTGCADNSEAVVVRHYTSAQISANNGESDVSDRSLTETQVTALTNWINTRTNCSGFSADIPDQPSLTIQLQGSNGVNSHIDVYKKNNGSATAYLYEGNRLAPVRCPLTDADIASLTSALNAQ
jgi:hypothetical protein